MNTKAWLDSLITAGAKKPLPVLSFPSVQLMGVSVRELVADAVLQARGMAAVAERVDAAAAVSFMDLSVEAEAFGSTIRFGENEIPTVTGRVVTDLASAEALPVPRVGAARTGVCLDGIRGACALITDRPVFAGCIGPFSLAGRLMDVTEILVACYEEPETVAAVLEKATEFLMGYIGAYKATGAAGIVMAEPLTGLLSPALAEEFSEPYVRRVVDAVQSDDFSLIYHNCGGSTVRMAESIQNTGAAAFHFGNAIDLSAMLPLMPSDRLVMGNIDPAGELRHGTPESVRAAVLGLMGRCAGYPNFLLSSGCDIPPLSPWENINALFAASREFYAR